ncbi:glycosyltransferase family 2 protein [candidate division CSSED10-310 bacterium]|uniref:Glycosyltransferase family 2 protein n=1 Tax=candidate division CSSED10-310 bacterium TaxID=2855610 RepID=A0ABV6YYE2_UNCC1
MQQNYPKVTFGIIVLNGEPFVRYNLHAIYPFAHEIIVVEGAVPSAAHIASYDGHSNDGTLEVLHDFKKEEDYEDKLIIITAEDQGYPNGFWPGEKDEQSKVYATRANGDYLWQVDIDEFYQPQDMKAVLEMLENDPEIATISFKQIQFWGGFSYYVDGWYLWREGEQFHRLFRWDEGNTYETHRPPTVLNSDGIDLRNLKWLNAYEMERRNIYLYHYSFVFPRQVYDKCSYYANVDWTQRSAALWWAQEVFSKLLLPYRVHIVYDYPSWLERFKGKHPPQIIALQKDISRGRFQIKVRHVDDIEQLLSSYQYRLGRLLLKLWEKWNCYWSGKNYNPITNPIRYYISLFFRNPKLIISAFYRKLKNLIFVF